MSMFKFENFDKQQVEDFRDAHYKANPATYPFYALLKSKNKIEKSNSVHVSEKVELGETLSTTSGGKEEGADFIAGDTVQYEYVENVCEIFSETVKISNTAKAVSKANYKSEYNKQMKQKNTAIARNIDTALLNGKKSTSGGIRKMGGVIQFAKQVEGTLTEEILDEALLHLYTQGYTGDVYFVINPANKKALDKILLDGNYTISIDNGTKETIGVAITSWICTFGFTVNILLDGNIAKDTSLLIDINPVKLKALREIEAHELPAMGDYEGGSLVAELSILSASVNAVAIKAPAVLSTRARK